MSCLLLRSFVLAVLFILPALAREPMQVPPIAPGDATHTTTERVGKLGDNRYYTPANQLITPAGLQVELPGLRPQAIALSPDGRLLVTSGKTSEIVVLDPKSGAVLQRVQFPGKTAPPKPGETTENPLAGGVQTKPDTGAQLSFTGLAFSPDGSRIYVSNVNGDIKVFAVEKGKVAALQTIPLPEARAPKRKEEIPAGLAVSGDGKQLYVALNLSNRVAEIDLATRAVLRLWDVGVAPFDVAHAAGKLYVSNWGGRRPGKGDLTGPAGRGTTVRVDPVRHIPSEGTVSIIDLAPGSKKPREIFVELRPSGLAVSPDERHVVVANSGSDTISVISTKSDAVVEKIWSRQPTDLFSATPNALTFDRSGKRLFVCNATQNAVGVIAFDPADRESGLLGMMPAAWFPGAIVFDPQRWQVCVANVKGAGSSKKFKPGEKAKNSTKDYFGTLSLMPVPNDSELAAMTRTVFTNVRQDAIFASKLPARPGQAAKPVPERVGEPSVFRHVIYIIKENRTYDQVLGDMKTGNGDPSLCTFGEKFTPNQHKLVREFVLLDNTYCSGIQSADGHHWTDSGITTDYVERGHAGWPRSYPNLKTEDALDALAYSPAGFIWDLALAHGKSLRNYGEACVSDCGWVDRKKPKPGWHDYYRDFVQGTGLTVIRCRAGIASLAAHSKLDSVGWDMDVPDILRADRFISELREYETRGGFPNLIILFLPNDHTGGTRAGGPTPGAQVADNDLAMGRVVEAVSRSKFWPETCIFAIEDDPQNGWDHVSGYRTTCYVASPYTRRGATVSTQYNQTSVLRTIELILGLPPMNIMDASATPMSDCFQPTPVLAPFTAVMNQVPLDQTNPNPKNIKDPLLRKDATVSAKLPLGEPDRCPEDVFNRILWRAMKGTRVPYPEWAITKLDDDD